MEEKSQVPSSAETTPQPPTQSGTPDQSNTAKSLITMQEEKVGWVGYLMLVFALIFFSGVFAKTTGALSALDFNMIAGNFGAI